MASALKEMIGKPISVITCDGRNIVGTLRGYDQVTNVILEECHERVYSMDAGVEQVVLGLYIIRGPFAASQGTSAWRVVRDHRKVTATACWWEAYALFRVFRRESLESSTTTPFSAGDNIAIIGEVDPERDAKTDLSKVRAEALKPVCHS